MRSRPWLRGGRDVDLGPGGAHAGPRGGNLRVADPGVAALADRARPDARSPSATSWSSTRRAWPPTATSPSSSTRPRLAGAKVVMVGDDRQLGAVEPGGAWGRWSSATAVPCTPSTRTSANTTAAEREALAELRAGDVARAVEFYVRAAGSVTAPDRDEALDRDGRGVGGRVDAGQGHGHVRLAPGQRGRAQPAGPRKDGSEGRLSGPELEAPGGTRYAAGDRIVTLAPGPRRQGRHLRARPGRPGRPRGTAAGGPDGRRA